MGCHRLLTVNDLGLKEPVQKRSQASLNRLLNAGAKLLEERGYIDFTIPELSRRARVSPGLIYGRFESKDALFYAIHDRELRRVHEEFGTITDPAHWEGCSLGQLLDGLVPEAADFIERHAPLFDVFLARGAVDEVVQTRGAEFMGELNVELRDLLLTRRDEIGNPDPDRAATMACQLILSAFVRRSHVISAPSGAPTVGLPWREMIEELPAVCRAYLLD